LRYAADKQTQSHTDKQTDSDECFTPATIVGVSKITYFDMQTD